MLIHTLHFNPFPVNTYVVADQKSKECVIVDAGCYYPEEFDALYNFIDQHAYTVKHLLATHLHLDHLFGALNVTKHYNLPLIANRNDEFLIAQMTGHAATFNMKPPSPPCPIGREVKEGDTFAFGRYSLQAIHAPGHSPGSIVYYCAQEGVAFVGDVVFKNSIGRSDLLGGDHAQLVRSIKEKLLTLPPETQLYPGHGEATTVENETFYNPYLL